MIRDARIGDAEAIAAIYNPYILETSITFEEIPVGADEMAKRIADTTSRYAWIVAEGNREEGGADIASSVIGGEILGYAYFSAWRTRAAYLHSAESSIYLSRAARGKGLGSLLYAELIERAKAIGIHALIGGIALPNEASVRLHERFGFKKVAHLEEVGYKFDRWIDVGYWELIL